MIRFSTACICCLLATGCSWFVAHTVGDYWINHDKNPPPAIPNQPDMLHGKAGPEASPIDIQHAVQVNQRKAMFGNINCTEDIYISQNTNGAGGTYIDGCDGTINNVTYSGNCETTSNLTTGMVLVRCWVPVTNITLTFGPFSPREQFLIDAGMPLILMHTTDLGKTWARLLTIDLRQRLMTTRPAISTNVVSIPTTNRSDYFALQWRSR